MAAEVNRLVDERVRVHVGDFDQMLNQRVGPIEKQVAEFGGGVTLIRTDLKDLRDEIVKLKGADEALVVALRQQTAEMKKDRLARARRKRRRTQ